MTPRLKYLQKWPHLKGNKEEEASWSLGYPQPRLSSALSQGQCLDGLFLLQPAETSGCLAKCMGTGPRKVPKKAQGGAEVGLVRPKGEECRGPRRQAHPHRHFGDLCPGRQSQTTP